MTRTRKWLCSCPDHSKRTHLYSTLNGGIPLMQRSWVNSKAGAKRDCLHIMNAKLSRGDPLDDFNDPPIERKEISKPTPRKGNQSFGFRSFKGFK